MNEPVGLFQDFALAEEDELHGPLPSNHIERLKRCVQDQNVLEDHSPC
jgi:hypothetical protein